MEENSENSINNEELTQVLIDYYNKTQSEKHTTTTMSTFGFTCNSEDKTCDKESEQIASDLNNNEILIERRESIENSRNNLDEKIDKQTKEIINRDLNESLQSQTGIEEEDEATKNFLIQNNLINTSSKNITKTTDNVLLDTESSDDENPNNNQITDNQSYNEFETILFPKRLTKRNFYSFDTTNSSSDRSTTSTAQLVTHYKEIKIIKTYNVITTFVFKETFNQNNIEDINIQTEYSNTKKELVEQKTNYKLINRDQLEELIQNKSKSEIIESEDDIDLYETTTKQVKSTVSKTNKPKKKSKLKKPIKRLKQAVPVKVAFRNFEPPKLKKKQFNNHSKPIIIDDINSSVRFTRSMAKSPKPRTLFKIKPVKTLKKPKKKLNSVSSESNVSVITLESDQNSEKLNKLKSKRNFGLNHEINAKLKYSLKNLEIRIERLSNEVLKKYALKNERNQKSQMEQIGPNEIDSKTLETAKSIIRKKSITLREILRPKFQPNEKAFALCTDNNYYPCIVKSFCQNGIYKCAFLYDSEENFSDLYEIKENKLIALEQLRENDSVMVYHTDDRQKYEKAYLCDLTQMIVGLATTGVRKTVKFCNMALFKENNIEEIMYRFKDN